MKTSGFINNITSRDKMALVSSVATKTGIVVSITLALYFYAMQLFGLHQMLILRGLNFLFLITGILFAIRYFTDANNKIDYLQGLRIGAQVTITASLPFALFMMVYLNLDAAFMQYIQSAAPLGQYLTPEIAACAILFEGVASGLIFTYIVMPYYKKEPIQ